MINEHVLRLEAELNKLDALLIGDKEPKTEVIYVPLMRVENALFHFRHLNTNEVNSLELPSEAGLLMDKLASLKAQKECSNYYPWWNMVFNYAEAVKKTIAKLMQM